MGRSSRLVGVDGRLLDHEPALVDEPLVDAEGALHPLRAVVRDDEHRRVAPGLVDEPADLRVEELVVIDDGVLEAVPRLVQVMVVVHVLPEGVVDPVDADLDEHEQVPGLGLDQPVHDLEPLLRHGVDLAQDLIAVLGPEDDVEDVRPEALLDLGLEPGRIGRLLPGPRRRDEAGDEVPGDRIRRVARRHADERARPARLADVVPEPLLVHRLGIGDPHLVVGIALAVAEAVEAQPPRVGPGRHDHPGRDGDGRVGAAELAPQPLLHEPLEDRELVPPVEDDLGRGAVEPDHEDLAVIH